MNFIAVHFNLILGFGVRVLKLFVIVPYIVIFGLGCMMIASGSYLLINVTDKLEEITILKDKANLGSSLVVATGVCLALPSFLGCCGVVEDNRKL